MKKIKKARSSNANYPLPDSLCFIVNTFECVYGRGGGGVGPCTERSKLNKFEHVWGGGTGTRAVSRGRGRIEAQCRGRPGPCVGTPLLTMDRHNDRQTRVKALPSPLRWWAVEMSTKHESRVQKDCRYLKEHDGRSHNCDINPECDSSRMTKLLFTAFYQQPNYQ